MRVKRPGHVAESSALPRAKLRILTIIVAECLTVLLPVTLCQYNSRTHEVCPRHHNMERPQAVDERHGLQTRKMAANTLNEYSLTADKWWHQILGSGEEVKSLHRIKKTAFYKEAYYCFKILHKVLVSLLNPQVNKLSGVIRADFDVIMQQTISHSVFLKCLRRKQNAEHRYRL